jgi:hypothetical protein
MRNVDGTAEKQRLMAYICAADVGSFISWVGQFRLQKRETSDGLDMLFFACMLSGIGLQLSGGAPPLNHAKRGDT